MQVSDGEHYLRKPPWVDQQTPQVNLWRPNSTGEGGCERLDILQTDWEEDLLLQRPRERRLEPIDILVFID